MKKAIMAKKLGMTQVFNEQGMQIPVTVLEAGPCVITQVKTEEKDGYSAVQVGFGAVKARKVTKPLKGHLEKSGLTEENFKKHLSEFRIDNAALYKVGSEIKADIFSEGDIVDVTGTSKGKGFQGSIKRHNQHRGPMTHGSKSHRVSGSMGANTSPGRVRKGKKLPGHMGSVTITVQSLEVVRVDMERNVILIKGAVPGAVNSIVTLKDAIKA
ncbi:MAG TPA: 50S ribosomal protein L3 [Clostridiales bacterium]|nr:MAG: 50S ribosomal protein L3 [Clostridiales bacterium GWD2_32_59]HAN09218.1 50S ribosomal protein L3 [Clostridiales bacterium]